MDSLYYRYSDYLKKRFGEKVYKLPINLPVTCPNRDGHFSEGGCIFCGEDGAGFESFSNKLTIKEQLLLDMEKMREIYKANKYIAYFQNFSNTYLPLDTLLGYIGEAFLPNVVSIALSTRPDCISSEYVRSISELSTKNNVPISIELGLQTANYHTLKKINRCHGLAEFIDAVLRIKAYDLEVCAHVILNLPWDNMDDVIETAKILSSLGVDQVKLHALYILKNTELAKMYERCDFSPVAVEEYIERAITFLEYLAPDIVIQRIIGRSPEHSSVFSNWGISWWKIHDDIQKIMTDERRFQGSKCDYLNGKALKKFNP